MTIEELEYKIAYYSAKYYQGEPEISDEEFDLLVEKLRALSPNSRVLATGWGFEVTEDKVKHKYSQNIGSLDKAKTYGEIPDRFKNKMVYVSPKLDGLSAVAYYRNGVLVQGITRGNGLYGKDITAKLNVILGNCIKDHSFTGSVRGELIISNSNWEKLKEKYPDLIAPRNYVAGIINRKDLDEDIQYVDLIVYKVVGQEGAITLNNRKEVLDWLRMNFKYTIPECYYPILNEASWVAYHKDTFEQFKKLGYGLDGLVLTSPDIQYLAWWENGVHIYNYTYNEIAFKFPSVSTTTVIKGMQWELSRTQRLVPVAVVEPIELSGAVVEKATCNNAQWVKDMQLGVGAEVEITRSNEVIPKILTVLQPSADELPTRCPVCSELLVWDGVDLKCPNPRCPNIEASDLQQWCESVGETDGLQYTIMKQYLDSYGIVNTDSLYENMQNVLDDLYSRKLSITETKILEFFTKLYINDVPAEKALVGLNIPRLGSQTAKILSSQPVLVDTLVHLAVCGVYSDQYEWAYNRCIELVKDATTTAIFNNLSKFRVLRSLYNNYFEHSRIIYNDKSSDNVKFIAVTGSLETMKRKDFEAFIKSYGYEMSTNIRKCEYLVTNDANSGSSKNKQAREYGVAVITEEEFLRRLRGDSDA